MSSREETLFSFEIFVHVVKDVMVPCMLPALAFRLLDFPTIILYCLEHKHIKKLKEKVEYAEKDDLKSMSRKTYVQLEKELPNLREKDGSFQINKGKSSLFKMNFNQLHNLLESVPLYLMLLDSWFIEKPKLLGSCCVPLHSTLTQLIGTVEKCGSDYPALQKESGIFKLYNLMGTEVAKVEITYKIGCFGNSFAMHVRVPSLKHDSADIFMKYEDQLGKIDTDDPVNGRSNHHTKLSVIPSDKIAKKITKEPTGRNISAPTSLDIDIINHKKLSTSSLEKVVSSTISQCKYGDKDDVASGSISNDMFCPPPLFYCSNTPEPVNPVPLWQQNEANNTGLIGDQNQSIAFIQDDKDSCLESDRPELSNQFDGSADQLVIKEVLRPTTRPNIYVNEGWYKMKANTKDKALQTETSSDEFSLLDKWTKSLSDIDHIIDQLNDLPILKSLLKEVVMFDRQQNTLKGKQMYVDSHSPKENPELTKKTSAQKQRIVKSHGKQLIGENHKTPGTTLPKRLKTASKKLQSGNKGKTVQNKKKLIFRTTRTHKLRYEMVSGVKKNPIHQDFHEDEQREDQGADRASTASDKTRTMILSSKYADDLRHSEETNGRTSKSPGSVDVYLPTEEDDNAQSLNDAIEELHLIDADQSEFGHTGIYSPVSPRLGWSDDDLGPQDRRLQGPAVADSDTYEAKSRSARLQKRGKLPVSRTKVSVKDSVFDVTKSLEINSSLDYSSVTSVSKSSVSSPRPKAKARFSHSASLSDKTTSSIKKVHHSLSEPSKPTKSDHSPSVSRSYRRKIVKNSQHDLTERSVDLKITSSESHKQNSEHGSEAETSDKNNHHDHSDRSDRSKNNRQSYDKRSVSDRSGRSTASNRSHGDSSSDHKSHSGRNSRYDQSDLFNQSNKRSSGFKAPDDERDFSDQSNSNKPASLKGSDAYSDNFDTESEVSSIDHDSPTPRHIVLAKAKLGYTL